MKYNIIDIKNYLVPEYPSLTFQYLLVSIFLISFFGIPMAICDPFAPSIFYLLLPIIILMDLFAIFILINVEKWQILYSLFTGIYCITLSVVLYISFYKIIYLILGIQDNLLLICSIGIYILILIVSWYKHFKRVKDGYYSSAKKTREKKGENYSSLIVGTSGGGLLLGQMLIHNTNHQTFMIISAFAALIYSYLMILGSHNIYKYYLMIKYKEYVKLFKLEKKKKARRK